jgi:hypothetical protein
VLLYTQCNISFRTVSRILHILNEFFGFGITSIPCPNSIENWVKKGGYRIYHDSPKDAISENYGLIIDESIMVGNEKMILTLGVAAEKKDDRALQKKDVCVLNMSVASSWNSTEIKKILEKVEEKVGKSPDYVVSDNDSKLDKSIREKGYIHLRDVGHSIALQIEKVYAKSDKLKDYLTSLAAVKAKEVMRPASYLLPPTQRSIARFMNLSKLINWGKQILNNFPRLNAEEKKAFDFLKSSHALLDELSTVFNSINIILKKIKTKGMSKKNIADSISILEAELNNEDNIRFKQVKENVKTYLEEESLKLKDDTCCWHGSSDIIESIFGYYKFRKSKNRLDGITPYVLLLPLVTHLEGVSKPSEMNFKHALESVSMKDLKNWQNTNLTENLAVKRKKILAA